MSKIFYSFLIFATSLYSQAPMTSTGFKIVTESPIFGLNTESIDKIAFYSDCGHCQYGKSDFNYFQIDLSNLKLDKTYKEFALGARLSGNLPVSKYPSKKDKSRFDGSKFKELEIKVNGNIDTYSLYGGNSYYAYKPWSKSGDRHIFLAKSKYFGDISLFTGDNEGSFKTDVSFADGNGLSWIAEFYSYDLNNKSFVSVKKSNSKPSNDLQRSEFADGHYVYVIDNNSNKVEQKITIYERKTGLPEYNVFYALVDAEGFIVLSSELYGHHDKNNKNYGIYIQYYSRNTENAKGKYIKVWESKLSSDFTSVGSISAVNGQIIVGGTSKNGGYLGYENPYLNIFDMISGKFKKEYYIPFKAEGEGQTIYNIIPLQTSRRTCPSGKYVSNGLNGTNGDLLICCQPYKARFEDSGFGKGILIRDYINSDGTFYNNLFNDESWKQNEKKNDEAPCVQNRQADLPQFSKKIDVLTGIVNTYGKGVDKTYNKYCWVAQDKMTKKIGLVSNIGEITIPLEYDCQDFVFYSKNFEENKVYFILTKNGKKGLVDMQNNVLVNFEFDALDLKADCNYVVCLKDKKYGVIDIKTGKVIIDCKFDRLSSLNYGYEWEPCDVIHAKNGDFSGFIDFKENIVFDNKDVSSNNFLEEFEKKMIERNLKQRQ